MKGRKEKRGLNNQQDKKILKSKSGLDLKLLLFFLLLMLNLGKVKTCFVKHNALILWKAASSFGQKAKKKKKETQTRRSSSAMEWRPCTLCELKSTGGRDSAPASLLVTKNDLLNYEAAFSVFPLCIFTVKGPAMINREADDWWTDRCYSNRKKRLKAWLSYW